MRPFVDFVHPDDLAATLAELAKPAAGADSIAFENRYAHQDAHVETHFYRIAQEAVRNAVSHGRASKIAVTLQVAKNQCTLAIRDDGAEISKDSVHCSGMRTMQYRARLIGASLWVWPDPELGTWVKRVFAPPSLLTKIISDA